MDGDKKKMLGLLITGGKPPDDEGSSEESEVTQDEAEKVASDAAFEALKADDREGFRAALRDFVRTCTGYAEED